jgi:hypothetical protein
MKPKPSPEVPGKMGFRVLNSDFTYNQKGTRRKDVEP